jgi:CPA2 family monovalent cation:H+ antiporter-2
MPHDLDVILTLTGGLSAALVLGLVTQRLRLSPIVGYLLAGVAVGPFTPGFVAHTGLAEQFAEMGVILLMFGVGLHFHLDELLAVRKVALPGALVQIAVATGLGTLLGMSFGWGPMAGVVFGLAVSVASTVVMLRVLADQDALHTGPGHIAVGWLLVEDIFTVLVLVLLPVFVAQDERAAGASIVWSITRALLKMAGLVAFTFAVGKRVIPWWLTYVARTRSRELFTLSVLVLALGIAVAAAQLFGASMALGAFLAGMVVGQSQFSARAASEALPMRDAFAVLFFVSVGMLFDPARVLDDVGLTLCTLAVVLLAKPLAAVAVVLVLRKPLKTALIVGLALAQIGEFSFILAALGRSLKVLPAAATQVLVVTAILSITLNPLLLRAVKPLSRWLGAHRSGPPELISATVEGAHRAIVVGYGPVGRTLVRLLRDNGFEPVVIELNYDTVTTLLQQGIHAIYGDASQPEILERAEVAHAGSLVFAASGSPPAAVIRLAKELNPQLLVLARAHYMAESKALALAGAEVVVTAETEVALALSERLLTSLGATPEQLDRERDRLRAELSASTTRGTPVLEKASS